ncbi:hypothetical protein MMC21_003707 [Puttea exsequens]|nr:hypothetical protein [Puttea exsequens]
MASASPKRAVSLFLPPEKAELLLAREIHNLVPQIPRKPVPRPQKRLAPPSSDSGRASSISLTSTIKAVEDFCFEYRPPSVSLNRLSYLDKQLPPTPPNEADEPPAAQTLNRSKSSKSQKSVARRTPAQPLVPATSRFSTRNGELLPNRAAAFSNPQSREKASGAAHSRHSAQAASSLRNSSSHPDIEVSPPPDSPEAWEKLEKIIKPPRKEDRASKLHAPAVLEEVDEEKEDRASRESWRNPWIPKEREIASVPPSDAIVPVTRSKSLDQGFNFWDDVSVRHKDDVKSSRNTSDQVEALALEGRPRRMTPMVPVGFTFHDGLTVKRGESVKIPRTSDTSSSRSKRSIPIGFTFHDGLTLRNDGIVRVASNASQQRPEVVAVKSTSKLPIHFSFYDGLTIGADGRVKKPSKTSSTGRDITLGTKSQGGFSVHYNFWDGLTFRDGRATSVNQLPNGMVRRKSKRMPVGFTFHDGLYIRVDDNVKKAVGLAPKDKSKRVTLHFTFHDGLTLRANNGAVGTTRPKRLPLSFTFHDGLTINTIPKGKQVGSRSKSKISYTFHDGLIIRTSPKSKTAAGMTKSKGMPISFTFHDGLNIRTSSKNKDITSTSKSKPGPIGWTFHDGVTIRNKNTAIDPLKAQNEYASNFKDRAASTASGKGKSIDTNLHPLMQRKKTASMAGPRRLKFSFWDGLTFTTVDAVSGRNKSTKRLTFTFHDGLTLQPRDGALGSTNVKQLTFTFHDGLKWKTRDPNVEAKRLAFTFHDGLTYIPKNDVVKRVQSNKPLPRAPDTSPERRIAPIENQRSMSSRFTVSSPSMAALTPRSRFSTEVVPASPSLPRSKFSSENAASVLPKSTSPKGNGVALSQASRSQVDYESVSPKSQPRALRNHLDQDSVSPKSQPQALRSHVDHRAVSPNSQPRAPRTHVDHEAVSPKSQPQAPRHRVDHGAVSPRSKPRAPKNHVDHGPVTPKFQSRALREYLQHGSVSPKSHLPPTNGAPLPPKTHPATNGGEISPKTIVPIANSGSVSPKTTVPLATNGGAASPKSLAPQLKKISSNMSPKTVSRKPELFTGCFWGKDGREHYGIEEEEEEEGMERRRSLEQALSPRQTSMQRQHGYSASE